MWGDFCCYSNIPSPIRGGAVEPPSLRSLFTVVEEAMKKRVKKPSTGLGKAQETLYSFCYTMNTHSYMFSVFPSGDKYASLPTGVVSSTIKVGKML